MSIKRTEVRSKIWNGKKYVILTGWTQEHKFSSVVKLFNHKRKWWLRYSFSNNTGPFHSKEAAINWWCRGGR